MKEAKLRVFFLKKCSAKELSEDLKNSTITKNLISKHNIVDKDRVFGVAPKHILMICNAALSGELDYKNLKLIGFALIASDSFEWDSDTDHGARVAEVLHEWASPEINFPLTQKNINLWKIFLMNGNHNLKTSGDLH